MGGKIDGWRRDDRGHNSVCGFKANDTTPLQKDFQFFQSTYFFPKLLSPN